MSKKQQSEEVSNVPGVMDSHQSLIALALDQIIVDKTQNLSRFAPSFKDVQDLSHDIVRRGQLQPVVVRPYVNGEGPVEGKYFLVAGFQRYDAITIANESGANLPVLARVVEANEQEALLDNLAENIKRKNQTPMDVSYAIRALSQAGMTQKEIAKEYGKSDAWVSNHSKFIGLRPTVQKAIHTGEIPLSVARELPGMTEEEQDAHLARIKEAQAGGAALATVETGKKKSNRGRKKKDAQVAGRQGVSAKEALGQLERLTLELKEVEKPTKAQGAAGVLYGLLTKYLMGRIGAQTLHNKVLELV